MLKNGDKVLVGFSGGPDSMALLHSLIQLKDKLGIKLYALHINHQLRGKLADKDEQFARSTANSFQIPFKSIRINVTKYAQKHKMSIEESARVLRYEYFDKVAKKLKCNKIAIGHNANDNAETVLLNLVRGSGLSGLSGIPPVRDNIIRPLIEISRQEIINYLKEQRLKYCQDLTNIELGYRRNYIRHKVMPKLLKINPSFIETVMRTSQIIRDINQDIGQNAENAKNEVIIKQTKSQIIIDIKKFVKYNIIIKREILRTLVPKMTFSQIEGILSLIEKPSGSQLRLAEDFYAFREYDNLYLSKTKPRKQRNNNLPKQWTVNIGKTTKIPELGLELNVQTQQYNKKADKQLMFNDTNYALFDKQQICLPLVVRTRRTGDRFIPYKGHEKKLKDILIDEKIPRGIRDRLPLLCDKNNILWIIGLRRSNIALITDKTKEYLAVKVIKSAID
ncbi:MAG: tRNA lysidine(34) synthetase TilS [candidate division WOR-3 bacterium]